MPVLLVQSCSASKQQCSVPVPALELYDGYFYKIIKKSHNDGVFRDDVILRILSAEHGVVHPTERVAYYDRRMTAERAEKLRSRVVESLTETVAEEDIDTVVVNAGEDYRPALVGLGSAIGDDVDLQYVSGRGIGEMGGQLKSFIRTDESSELQVQS